jgi:hypothetical protein
LDTHARNRTLLVVALRCALVAALVAAVWAAYRRVPHEAGSAGAASDARGGATTLRIVLRGGGPEGEAAQSVQLYPIDVAAARREFEDERRYGLRFEDFVTRRMGARQPVTARFDGAGLATVSVPAGRWWVHAALAGAHEVSWRLPVDVSGREQTIELTPANAFTRTKSF